MTKLTDKIISCYQFLIVNNTFLNFCRKQCQFCIRDSLLIDIKLSLKVFCEQTPASRLFSTINQIGK